MPKSNEKRLFPRLNAYHLAKYRIAAAPGKGLRMASIEDIGGGGVRLQVGEEIPVFNILQLYINFPRVNQPISCLAKVVWTKKIGRRLSKYKVGGEFVNIEDMFRQAIIGRVSSIMNRFDKKK